MWLAPFTFLVSHFANIYHFQSLAGRADRFINKLTRSFSNKAMDTDNKEEAPKKTRKVKKQVRKGDLPIASGTSSLPEAVKTALLEKESAMIMEDKLVADTEEKKNELETYIYDLRNKLDDQYAEFASEEEKTNIKAKLDASEVSFLLSSLSLFPLALSDQPTPCRTGSTTRAMTPPRPSTSPNWTSCAPWPALSCSATLRR